jgi:hypothetical protein
LVEELARLQPENGVKHFVSPEQLYQRACVLDPHREAFSQWMDWAKREPAGKAEQVAQSWHKIRPGDLEPVLYLMEYAKKRKAFHTALMYLDKAERIDGVHSSIRRARLHLLAGRALQHIQQKKARPAEELLAEMAALPQAQQGDRPAFLAALRYMAGAVRGDSAQASVQRAEVERLLESGAAASLLILSVAQACKRSALEKPAPVQAWTDAEKANLPAAIARVSSLARDMELEAPIPWTVMAEASKQFQRTKPALATGQLLALADAAIGAAHLELLYAVSAAGLASGGAQQARFLLLRAQALPGRQFERRALCAAAAAEIARKQGDAATAEEAGELLSSSGPMSGISVTAEQAAEVLRKEKASSKPGGRAPSYRGILGPKCNCPECRRARGEAGPYDEFDDDDEFDGLDDVFDLPPREILEQAAKALPRSGSFEEFLNQILRGGKKRKKGRRK